MAATDTTSIVSKLVNSDEDVVLETLELLKDKGNATVIAPLLDLLLTDPSYSVTLATTDLLSNMKDPASIDRFLEVLVDKKYQPIQHHLLSILWNSSFSERAKALILPIAQMGVNGSFNTLIEALTVIENLEAPFEEEQLLESISVCKSFIASKPNDEKLPLVKELLNLLLNMDDTNSELDLDEEL